MARKLRLQERAQEMGAEIVDPTPVEIPVSRRPPTLKEQLQAYIRDQISAQAQATDHGSFQDEDDFSIEDEDDWQSPYELQDMHFDPIDGSPPEKLDGVEDQPVQSSQTLPPQDQPVTSEPPQPPPDPVAT